MVEGTEPPWGAIYALSEKELQVMREYRDTMLKSGKIRPSKSPTGAPILFVPKIMAVVSACVWITAG